MLKMAPLELEQHRRFIASYLGPRAPTKALVSTDRGQVVSERGYERGVSYLAMLLASLIDGLRLDSKPLNSLFLECDLENCNFYNYKFFLHL